MSTEKRPCGSLTDLSIYLSNNLIMRILITILLFSLIFSTTEIISNTLPPLTTSIFKTQLQSSQLYKGQKYTYKYPQPIAYYSYAILNNQQLIQNQIDCKWSQPQYNFSNVAITKNLNLTKSDNENEKEKIITTGFINKQSKYYTLTNKGRLLKIQTQMSTRTLKVIKELKINLNETIQSNTEFINYKDSLVFKSNTTLIIVQNDNIKYQKIQNISTIIKIISHNNSIYILTSQKLIRWNEGTQQTIQLGQVQSLIDIDSNHHFERQKNKLYVLDSKKNIFIISSQSVKQYTFNTTEGIFTKIRVFNDTIQCIYNLQKSNFIVQLYNIENKLILNKIYPINSHINNILMFEHYMLLIHDYHLSLVFHSSSRLIPNLQYNQIINSLLIVGIKQIVKIEGNMVMVIKQHEMFLSKEIGVSLPELVCQFEKAGAFNISLQFQLPLSHCYLNLGDKGKSEGQMQAGTALNGYCSTQFEKSVTVKQAKKFRMVLFVYILAGVIFIFMIGIMIGGVIYCTNIFRKYEEKINLLKKKKDESEDGKDKKERFGSDAFNDTIKDDKKEYKVVDNITNTLNETGIKQEKFNQ